MMRPDGAIGFDGAHEPTAAAPVVAAHISQGGKTDAARINDRILIMVYAWCGEGYRYRGFRSV